MMFELRFPEFLNFMPEAAMNRCQGLRDGGSYTDILIRSITKTIRRETTHKRLAYFPARLEHLL